MHHQARIQFSAHALERMAERGATREEVEHTILNGEVSPARQGRTRFQRTLPFNAEWNGRHYVHKQLAVFAVEEEGDWIVITLICRYF